MVRSLAADGPMLPTLGQASARTVRPVDYGLPSTTVW